MKKWGQTILELATSIKGQDVHTYGWHTDLGKEEFLTGYIKVPKGQEEALLGPAAWQESLLAVAERLQTDPEYKRTKSTVGGKGNRRNVHGLLRQGTHASQHWESEDHLEERRKQCAESGRSVQRTSRLDQSLHPGQPVLVGTNATKQYLERRGIEVMTASMSSPRTKAQGWLKLAKSDTKDMEQDHFWMCGEHDITCRKWKKGPQERHGHSCGRKRRQMEARR